MRKSWIIAFAFLAGCSNPPSASNRGGSAADKSGESQGNGIRLTLHQVMDTAGTGKPAATYLLPAGYTAADTLKWMPDNDLTPVVATMILKSNDGQVQMESLSGVQTGYGHAPTGNVGIDPPANVSDFLAATWKRIHPGQDFTVVDKQDSDIPEASHPLQGGRQYGKRGWVQIKFVKDGTTFLVKTGARVDVMETVPEATAMGGTFDEGRWLLSNAYTVTAPEAKFEDAMKLFGIVLTSYRTDPHFYNTMMQAREIIQRRFYAGERGAMEMSRIISQTNDRMSDAITSNYRSAQTSGEQEASNFDDYIRGVDRYKDDDGQVSLPSGYEHAWSDGNGNYLVSKEHGLDPNVDGPNGNWHELERQQ